MELSGVDPDDWAIFLVHLLDAEEILPAKDDVIVKFVPCRLVSVMVHPAPSNIQDGGST
jgi:hypothetical protein